MDNRQHLFEAFGEHVFNEHIQRKRLPDEIFQSLQETIKSGEKLNPDIAHHLALAIKEWAIEKGATHFCRWFEPSLGFKPERSHAIFHPSDVTRFCSKALTFDQSDPSSSVCFEGSIMWDISSSPFVLGRLLMIPSVVHNWSGDALDKKTPLLRSMQALNTQALRVLHLFGDNEAKRVSPFVGSCQQYFLIDEKLCHERPDLLSVDRTLFGRKPIGSQKPEMIGERVKTILEEAQQELLLLGIPIKAWHHEIAPSQYEISLGAEPANIAVDHQMLLMQILKRVAKRHRMVPLFHEKPFAQIESSGKSLNWSLINDQGKSLLDFGESAETNAQSLLFYSAVLRALHKYAKQWQLGVMILGHDLNLDSPCAYLCNYLSETFQCLNEKEFRLGHSRIQKKSGRYDTESPIAFMGNMWTFRSLGSSESIAKPLMILNTIVAESLDCFATELEKGKQNFYQTLHRILSSTIEEIQSSEKEGDAKIKSMVEASQQYTASDTVALFTKYRVCSRRELATRQTDLLASYVKKVMDEAKIASEIVHTKVIPGCVCYLRDLADVAAYLDSDLLKLVTKELTLARKSLKTLDDAIAKIPTELSEQAEYIQTKIIPILSTLRIHVDNLEEIVSDKCWPLPKYRELLFIR